MRGRLFLGVVLAALMAPAGSAWGASPPWVWRTAGPLDPGARVALACPSSSLCVAVDGGGNLLVSRAPAAGIGSWSRAPVTGTPPFTSVACASTSVCVAGDSAGGLSTVLDPGAPGGPSVSRGVVDAGQSIVGIACPSASECVAAAGDDLLVSEDPATGGGSWRVYPNVDQSQDYECVHYNQSTNCSVGLIGVSCSSATSCQALDFEGGGVNGNPQVGFTPSGGVVGMVLLDGACVPGGPCLSECGIAEGAYGTNCPGENYAATDLCGTTPACYQVSPIELDSLFCPARSLCFTGDQAGDLLASANPTGGPSTWIAAIHRRAANASGRLIVGVACPAANLCVAVDATGALLLGASPPTAGRLRNLLSGWLQPMGVRLPGLLRRNGYRYAIASPSASRLRIRWTLSVDGRGVLVATGGAAFPSSGVQPVKVRLTRAGRALLRRGGRVRITATATLAGAGPRPIRCARSFTLTS